MRLNTSIIKRFTGQGKDKKQILMSLKIELINSSEVMAGRQRLSPIVALESTVLTHGLPRPQNLQLAHDMEAAVREEGATPATVGFLDGCLHIGLSEPELDRLANEQNAIKVGPRDIATVLSKKISG